MKIYNTVIYAVFAILVLTGLSYAQQMYIYPNKGQSQAQKNKDMSQCNTWAVNQTGFDPSAPYYPSGSGPRQPSRKEGIVESTAKGAILGTVIGAITGNVGKGAAIGASSGAIVGGFNKYDEKKEKEQYQRQYNEQQSREYAAKRSDYDRAYKACLQGRGYTVN